MSYHELKSEFDSHKSFYGKAKYYETWLNDNIELYSYNRLVCEIEGNQYYLYDRQATDNMEPFSATTIRHIKEFLLQNGFKAGKWSEVKRNASGINRFGEWEGNAPHCWLNW